MRLLIVSQYFWPENFRVNEFATAMQARGHDVTVLTGWPNYPDGAVFPEFRGDPARFADYRGIPVVRVPLIPRGNSSIRLMLNYLSFVVTGLLLGPWRLRGRRFDAIFVFQTSPVTAALPAMLLRRLKRAPLLMWILDLWPDTLDAIGVVRSPRLLGMVGALVRFIYAQCDLLLIQSRAFTEKVARYTDRRKLRYFPGWAEAVFEASTGAPEPAPEAEPAGESFRVLFAGNIGQAQDLDTLVAAADRLRDRPVHWLVVGDGRAAGALRQAIAERGLERQVSMLGRFPLEHMPSFFASADALLVSLADEPIFAMTIPGKVQSYLAAGRPILAVLNGEGAEVVRASGAGLVSPSGDAAALAANVERLMAMSPGERCRMGAAGRDYAEREFSREALLDSFERWAAEAAF